MAGPPVSGELRGAGGPKEPCSWPRSNRCGPVRSDGRPVDGAVAGGCERSRPPSAPRGGWSVSVAAGEPSTRSYCGPTRSVRCTRRLGWVRSEGVAVDDDGTVLDLTIRSFGIIPARAMPAVEIVVEDDHGPPLPAGDTVFAAVATAAWLAAGLAPSWPVELGGRHVSTPVGPYSPAVRAGPWLVCSGQIGIEQGADGPVLVAGGFEAQVRKALANLSAHCCGGEKWAGATS